MTPPSSVAKKSSAKVCLMSESSGGCHGTLCDIRFTVQAVLFTVHNPYI